MIWGTNPVNTQVNVMTHATRARKERGAKIVAVDVYMNGTMEQADLAVLVRPGTDGALACAVMHCLFRDGLADRDYLEKYTDAPRELEEHVRTRSPEWASAITGCPVETIEEFAAARRPTKRTYFRLGYGFGRSRNGTANMHAASCIAAVSGSWPLEGGGAFHNNGAIYHWNKTMTEGLDAVDPSIRMLDQSRIGPILVGEPDALINGVPVTALLIQNTNPVSVAPEQDKVKRGFAREDLFVCVHEQFMTETAQMADVVLPATMFMEHDDFYQGGGHQYIQLGPKLIDPPGECRTNHEVHCALAKRLGAQASGLRHDAARADRLDACRIPAGARSPNSKPTAGSTASRISTPRITPRASPGRTASSASSRTGRPCRSARPGSRVRSTTMPALPDHWDVIEEATAEHPFRLGTSPARNFLNSTFNETPTSLAREHAADRDDPSGGRRRARHRRRRQGVLGNTRGEVRIHAKIFRRRAPRRADRGIDLAERRLRGRARASTR